MKRGGNEQNLQLQTWLSKRTNKHKLINDAVANIRAVEKGMFEVGHFLTCKLHKSESAKVLENRGSLRFVENKIKPKTCKLLVNSILALVNHCSYKDYFATTIEWE